jgi:hypothetical protein
MSENKEKLNKCLEILDSTDLTHSMLWLWTWSTIDNILKDEMYTANVTLDEMWVNLSEVAAGSPVLSLEYGGEQHLDDVTEWMLSNYYIKHANQ